MVEAQGLALVFATKIFFHFNKNANTVRSKDLFQQEILLKIFAVFFKMSIFLWHYKSPTTTTITEK
jgi:hypothetical protein